HASREDRVSRGERTLALAEPGRAGSRIDAIPACRQLADPGHLGIGLDPQPPLLSEPEIVLVEGVLRIVAAAGHAGPALDAAGALRTHVASAYPSIRGRRWSASER